MYYSNNNNSLKNITEFIFALNCNDNLAGHNRSQTLKKKIEKHTIKRLPFYMYKKISFVPLHYFLYIIFVVTDVEVIYQNQYFTFESNAKINNEIK